MSDDYGAAEPIIGPIKRAYQKFVNRFGDPSEPAHRGKVDTSWHDEEVRKANESFKPSKGKMLGSKRKSPKSTVKRTAKRK